jgi:diguanylate cyclase (GGDEF)-like protein/PAS domain S-box-containing protein
MRGPAGTKTPWLVLMLVITLVLSGGLVALNLYQGHVRLETQERARLLSQGHVVRQNLLRQLDSTDHVLQSLRASVLGLSDERASGRDLAILAKGIPGISALFVVNEDGRVTQASQSTLKDSDQGGNSVVRLARWHRNPSLLYVAPPVQAPDGAWAMSIARVLTDANGDYAGAVVAELNTQYFSTLLASVNYAPDMLSSLSHSDGTVFLTTSAAVGAASGEAQRLPESVIAHHKDTGDIESFDGGVQLDSGAVRHVAVLTIDSETFRQSAPLYVSISRDQEAIFGPWYREAKGLSLAYGLVAMLLVLGSWIYPRRQMRQQDALLRTERALRINASRLQLAATAMGLGQWEYDPKLDRSVWDANMFGIYDVDLSTGSYQDYWRQRVLPEDIARVERELTEIVAGLRPYDILFRVRHRNGALRTVRSWGHVFRDPNGEPEYMVGIDEDVTERVLAEENLAQRERDLKALLDNLPSLVAYWDAGLRNRFGNRTYGDWFGLDPDQMPGMHLSELLDAATFKRNLPYAEAALLGQRQLFEQTLPGASGGEPRQTLVHYVPDMRDGEVRGFYAMVADISAAKKAESALRQSESRYRTLAQLAPVGIFRLDTLGQCIYVNEHWLNICGLSEQQALGAGWLQSVHALDRSRVEQQWQRAMQERTKYADEFRYERGDGKLVWVLARIAPELVSGNGNFGYVGTLTEISNLKEAESQLRLAASVFSNTQDGIVVTNRNNLIVDINPAFTSITGYERSEVLGKNPWILSSGRHNEEFYAEMWRELSERGSWRGEIWNRRKSGEDYAELLSVSAVKGDDGELIHYVGVFSDITRFKRYEAELSRMAHFDPLTALPNRRLLADRLTHAIARSRRSGTLLAVCYLDLDGFKPVNDRFGHEAGDRLLLSVAFNLQEALRADDTVARLGGDEFVLLLNGIVAREECDIALQRVLDVVANTQLDDVPLSVSASIGVTLFPSDDSDADALLRHADQAMYLAKEAGRNRYHVFDPVHDKQLRAQREALDRLSQALEAQEFCLYYQPKVNLLSGEVIGAEALIRWRHPERGLTAPGEFLPLLEGTELEVQVGEWVIETALSQIEAWKAQGIRLSVSANVSPEHLRHPDFIANLARALARHPDVVPGDFELEILESAAIGDIENASRILMAGAALGVRFALDDFGTGYSSLTYFRRLPIAVLKIDQTFVRDMLHDPDDLGIVDSVVRLADTFDRTTIAEGVETMEHGAMLLLLGCHLAQGYGIARPMPADDIPAWLQQWAQEGSWRAMSENSARHADVGLLVAIHGEAIWGDGVIASLNQGSRGKAPVLASNACRLGRWWHGAAQRRYGAIPEFQLIGPLHERVHDLAAQLLTQAASGDEDAAREQVPEFLRCQQALLAGIDNFTAAIQRDPAAAPATA